MTCKVQPSGGQTLSPDRGGPTLADRFATEVYPLAVKYIAKSIRDEELRAIALVLCWWKWINRKQDFPPRTYARLAVIDALHGRDLPGVVTNNHQPDALDRGRCWQGGGMSQVKDREPGPERLAIWREQIARLYRLATPKQRAVMDLTLQGYSGREIAKALDIDPHTVIELRRQIRAKQ
jgi:DNA-binding CsgD family transcriptional regulator